MPKVTYGDKPKKRVQQLVEALIDLANNKNKNIKSLKCEWNNKDDASFNLVVETTLTALEELTKNIKLTKTQIRVGLIEHLEKDLKILEDDRKSKRGSKNWKFTLKLWSKNKQENLMMLNKKWEEEHPHTTKISQPMFNIFPRSTDKETMTSLKNSLNSSNEIKIYSLGCNFFWRDRDNNLEILKKRIKSKELSTVRICLANPYSPEILLRLIHEKNQLRGLHDIEDDLWENFYPLAENYPEQVQLKLFEHYPTYAMLIFDKQIYVYLYPFKKLGNSSPTFYWGKEDEINKFFYEQFEYIWDNSEEVINIWEKIQNKNNSENYTSISKSYKLKTEAIPKTKNKYLRLDIIQE